jgi:hypothetical protein
LSYFISPDAKAGGDGGHGGNAYKGSDAGNIFFYKPKN